MALWFSGATGTHGPVNGGATAGQHAGRHCFDNHRYASHLDPSTLTPITAATAHGRRRAPQHATEVGSLWAPTSAPRDVAPRQLNEGLRHNANVSKDSLTSSLEPAVTPRKEGVRIVNPHSSVTSPIQRMSEAVHRPPPPPSKPAPFASDLNNTPIVPYTAMRRKVTWSSSNATRDGDAFVLMRSRTPPTSARHRETDEEGFCVLMASSLKSRANPQMVSHRSGRSTVKNAEQDAVAAREKSEALVSRLARERSERALIEEQRRQSMHDLPTRAFGRRRCTTPPAGGSHADPPFALNIPGAPREIVGKPVVRQVTPRRTH